MKKFDKEDVLELLEKKYNFLNDVRMNNIIPCTFEYKKGIGETKDIFFNNMQWRDPDAYSKKLYQCHEYLMNRQGEKLGIKMYADYDSAYILQDTNDKKLRLASDYIGPSGAIAFNENVEKIEIGKFLNITRTFGGHILFPKHTSSINQRRASLFTDRIDLALEDIQRHYSNTEESRLVIGVDIDWFNKFSTFENFVDFFYLQDFMDKARNPNGTYKVKELAPFEDIEKTHSTMPVKFQKYIDNNVKAIEARNKRIIEALRTDL